MFVVSLRHVFKKVTMKNEVTQKDFDMPQLRQMVLDNTERINKNELIISQMRKETLEQSRKAVERDEMLENSRREHDRWSQRMRETLDEIAQIARRSQIEREKRDCEWEKRMREQEARSAEDDRKMREQFKENDRWMKEQFAENDRKMRERMEESDRKMREQFEETEKQLKDTSLEVKRLSRQLSGTTGHIVEGLVSSSTEKIFHTHLIYHQFVFVNSLGVIQHHLPQLRHVIIHLCYFIFHSL